MKRVPNEISASSYVKLCRDDGETWQSQGDVWVPARPYNVGWSPLDAISTRFRLAWKVFTGEADALTWSDQ